MWNKLKTRIRNPKVVTAVVSGVLLILVNLGLIDIEMSDKALEITNTLLAIGVSVGVFSNPDSHLEE